MRCNLFPRLPDVLSVNAVSGDGAILHAGDPGASIEWWVAELRRLGHAGQDVRLMPVTLQGQQPDHARHLSVALPVEAPNVGAVTEREQLSTILHTVEEGSRAKVEAARATESARYAEQVSRLTVEAEQLRRDLDYWRERYEAADAARRQEREQLTERVRDQARAEHERELARVRRALVEELEDARAEARRAKERAERDIEDEAARTRRTLEDEAARRRQLTERHEADLVAARARVVELETKIETMRDAETKLRAQVERQKIQMERTQPTHLSEVRDAVGLLGSVPDEQRDMALSLIGQQLGIDLQGSFFDRLVERAGPVLWELLGQFAAAKPTSAPSLPAPATETPATEPAPGEEL